VALADLAERDLARIAVCQTVTVRARSFPGRTFSRRRDCERDHLLSQINRPVPNS
jgi:hypothetical protein